MCSSALPIEQKRINIIWLSLFVTSTILVLQSDLTETESLIYHLKCGDSQYMSRRLVRGMILEKNLENLICRRNLNEG